MALNNLINDHLDYFQKFDVVKVYYDGGQAKLAKRIDDTFGVLRAYQRKPSFDHVEKKLFQVADMLTYVDKIIHKYTEGIKLTKTERGFFSVKQIRTTIKELKTHRLKSK